MKYREALSIGSPCDGVIRCTYATLYDDRGARLFTIRRAAAVYAHSADAMTGQNPLVQITPDVYLSGGDTVNISFDMPIVQAMAHSEYPMVPATLTDEARNLMAETIRETKITKYTIWIVPKNSYTYKRTEPVKDGKIIFATQYTRPTQFQILNIMQSHNDAEIEVTEEKVITPAYQKIMDLIERGGEIYVKPAAFEWYPLNADNIASKTIDVDYSDLQAELDAAKRELDSAKAILAGSAAIAIF